MENSTMDHAIKKLKNNLSDVARVFEWADLMGYENPKRFSEIFLRHHGVRPQKIMELVRLESIIRDLRNKRSYTNLKIARMHSLPNEKTLNNFTNYHSGHSPTTLRGMPSDEVDLLMEKLWKKIMDEYGVGKVGSEYYEWGR